MERIQGDNYRLANRVVNTEKSWNRSEALTGTSPYSDEKKNATSSFLDQDENNSDISYECTLREVRTESTVSGDKTLKVWVEDTCWHDGGTEQYKVTENMVDLYC